MKLSLSPCYVRPDASVTADGNVLGSLFVKMFESTRSSMAVLFTPTHDGLIIAEV